MTSSAVVLVVEDNPLNFKLVRDVLVHAGYEVVHAATGEDGVRLARDCHPDLVLMDLQLPGIDGAEALRRLREDPESGRVPVVAVTALAMKEDHERAAAAGFDGYIEKPLSVRTLPDQVAAFLRDEDHP